MRHALCATAALVLGAQAARADAWFDVFRPGLWNTTLNLGADLNLQSTSAPGTKSADFSSNLYREGITVQNQGFAVLDPRLVMGNATVNFSLLQASADSAGTSTSQNATVTDYFIDTYFFQETPYTGSLAAGHSETVTSLVGGGSTVSKDTRQGASFYWREDSVLRDRDILPYFSAALFATHEHLDQTTTYTGQRYRYDEERDVLRLDAQNGLQTGDLYVHLQDTDVTNRLYAPGSYHGRYADLLANFDFGEYLDHQSETHFNYNERRGDIDYSTLNAEQDLSFQHTDYLSTTFQYVYSSSDSDGAVVTTNQVNGGVQYNPYANLYTTVNLFGTRVALPSGTIDTDGTYANLTYDHGLPGSGQLTAALGGGLQYNNSQLQSDQVPVFDSPYQAPPQLGVGSGFDLKDPFVVEDSIVVVDVRDGQRVIAQNGVDYTVAQQGSVTRVLILATSPVILPNDPLQITYLYQVDPSLKSRMITNSVYVVANWDWIAVSLSHNQTQQDPLAGQQAALLVDTTQDILGVTLNGSWGVVEASGTGTASRYRATNLKYDDYALNGTASYQPAYNWKAGLSASYTEMNYFETHRVSRYTDVQFDVAWNGETGWWVDGYLLYRRFEDTDLPLETQYLAAARVRRNWARLSLTAAAGVGERARGDVQSTYFDFHVAVVRSF